MKVKHEVKLKRTAISMNRWICGFTLKEIKKNAEIAYIRTGTSET